MFTSSFRYVLHANTLPNILKKTKRRLVTNEVRTRSERGTKRGQKLPGTDPYPNPGQAETNPQDQPKEQNKHAAATRTEKSKSTAWHTLIQEQRLAKTTYMTNPKCLNVIHHNISLYILLHAILSYLNLANPHKHICYEKKKRRMADTHLNIETTYITYPICYTMMLPNMPFRKADAHPLRLNTRCKDLTLVPSRALGFWS